MTRKKQRPKHKKTKTEDVDLSKPSTSKPADTTTQVSMRRKRTKHVLKPSCTNVDSSSSIAKITSEDSTKVNIPFQRNVIPKTSKNGKENREKTIKTIGRHSEGARKSPTKFSNRRISEGDLNLKTTRKSFEAPSSSGTVSSSLVSSSGATFRQHGRRLDDSNNTVSVPTGLGNEAIGETASGSNNAGGIEAKRLDLYEPTDIIRFELKDNEVIAKSRRVHHVIPLNTDETVLPKSSHFPNARDEEQTSACTDSSEVSSDGIMISMKLNKTKRLSSNDRFAAAFGKMNENNEDEPAGGSKSGRDYIKQDKDEESSTFSRKISFGRGFESEKVESKNNDDDIDIVKFQLKGNSVIAKSSRVHQIISINTDETVRIMSSNLLKEMVSNEPKTENSSADTMISLKRNKTISFGDNEPLNTEFETQSSFLPSESPFQQEEENNYNEEQLEDSNCSSSSLPSLISFHSGDDDKFGYENEHESSYEKSKDIDHFNFVDGTEINQGCRLSKLQESSREVNEEGKDKEATEKPEEEVRREPSPEALLTASIVLASIINSIFEETKSNENKGVMRTNQSSSVNPNKNSTNQSYESFQGSNEEKGESIKEETPTSSKSSSAPPTSAQTDGPSVCARCRPDGFRSNIQKISPIRTFEVCFPDLTTNDLQVQNYIWRLKRTRDIYEKIVDKEIVKVTPHLIKYIAYNMLMGNDVTKQILLHFTSDIFHNQDVIENWCAQPNWISWLLRSLRNDKEIVRFARTIIYQLVKRAPFKFLLYYLTESIVNNSMIGLAKEMMNLLEEVVKRRGTEIKDYHMRCIIDFYNYIMTTTNQAIASSSKIKDKAKNIIRALIEEIGYDKVERYRSLMCHSDF